jgi:Tfp pilus assembly protein PilF
MKLKALIAAICLTGSLSVAAQTAPLDPVTQAMMKVYEQVLTANPQDYETYFKRASEYYKHDQYLRALSDVDNAIKYTPAIEKPLLFQEYSLRGNIYYMTERYAEALADFKKALELDPTSYVTIYEIANCEYETNDFESAKANYKKLQRINNRSAEALIGLARIAARENNFGLANDYINEVVDLAPASAESYIRRASVRKIMNNNAGAVEDLLVAISINQGNSRAIQELVIMGNTDYTATMTGLSSAIRTAPNVALFYYLRATIAMSHYRYQAALTDFHTIIDQNLYNYPGLYDAMAQCNLALGKYPEALKECNFAIGFADDNAPYYVTLARIRRAMGESELALEAAQKAVKKDPRDNNAMVEEGLCLISEKKYQEAAERFGEAMVNDDTNAWYFMLRAWALNDFMKQSNAAVAVYKRVLDLEYPENDVRSFRGFAALFAGDRKTGDAWIESILAQPDNDGILNYYGACYYAQAGDKDNAFRCMEKSLTHGYANAYDWKLNSDARINIAPLRSDERFNALMSKYDYLFL